jgi:DNA-binding CsgD family transcriptional regulator
MPSTGEHLPEHVSVRTVDTHVDHVLTKLGFSNRSQLVAWAYESGLARSDGE